jgi:hypothetical protein
MDEITRRWGPWGLRGTDLVWQPGSGAAEYPVDLLTCTDSAQVLDWICQIAGRHTRPDDPDDAASVNAFVHAVNEILHPQAHLCSWGKSSRMKQRDIKAAIERAARHGR